MKIKYYMLISIAALWFIDCGGPSEPKEYIHTQAGFKITTPAGWKKTSEDHEIYEFRSGDYKLVEVGGFDLPVPPEDLFSLPTDEFVSLLRESTLDGLDGYCLDARIRDYWVGDERETVWGDRIAYRVQAKGYSTEALTSMVIDIIAIVHEEKSRIYMFASQIKESIYPQTKKVLELMIASFQLTE